MFPDGTLNSVGTPPEGFLLLTVDPEEESSEEGMFCNVDPGYTGLFRTVTQTQEQCCSAHHRLDVMCCSGRKCLEVSPVTFLCG